MLSYVKRTDEEPSGNDGYRVLVDRVWTRGATRQRLQLDAWMKELAPSTTLRKWFAHDPKKRKQFKHHYFMELDGRPSSSMKKRKQFKHHYFMELDGRPEEVGRLLETLGTGPVTPVYSARDDEFNDAIALKEYLVNRMDR